jgi:hypothetical protein
LIGGLGGGGGGGGGVGFPPFDACHVDGSILIAPRSHCLSRGYADRHVETVSIRPGTTLIHTARICKMDLEERKSSHRGQRFPAFQTRLHFSETQRCGRTETIKKCLDRSKLDFQKQNGAET